VFIYSRAWMAETPAERARFEAQGRSASVRLKMPRDGFCRFTDLVCGEMEFQWALEQDHVIQRADGTCLYHLASAVDDRDMRITHVIRSREHLSNAPRQIFILQGLGHEPPAFAHLPYVAAPGDTKKLSKRKIAEYLKNPEFRKIHEHGRAIAARLGEVPPADAFNPVLTEFYERAGYIPEAIINYLLLLGWSYDDKTELFNREEMIDRFSLEGVKKGPASFDPQKLRAFQGRYMRALPDAERVACCLPFLEGAGLIAAGGEARARGALVAEAAGARLVVAGDVLEYDDFFLADDALPYDEAAFEKRLKKAPGAAGLLARLRARLAAAEAFDAAALEGLLSEFMRDEAIESGQIVHALRVALTGKAVGFGLFDALAILGRARSLARIDRALSRLDAGGR
jgi:glutamyl-tRNA synthetase